MRAAFALPVAKPSFTMVCGKMVDDECWTIRAQADALRSEVSTLRGVVAALRTPRPHPPAPVSRLPTAWPLVTLAFAFGIAATLLVLGICRVALCP